MGEAEAVAVVAVCGCRTPETEYLDAPGVQSAAAGIPRHSGGRGAFLLLSGLGWRRRSVPFLYPVRKLSCPHTTRCVTSAPGLARLGVLWSKQRTTW